MRKRSQQRLLPVWAFFLVLMILLTGCSSSKNDNPRVNVTILQTTDLHNAASGVGSFNAYTPMDISDADTVKGGWARLASKIQTIRLAKRMAGGAVLLVDSGDFNMGTVYDMLWNSNPAPFQFLSAMQYDFTTFGNHEFDYGPKKLALMINKAKAATGGFAIPIIATNTVFDGIPGTADDDLEALNQSGAIITDYYVKTFRNGLKVGIIGLMGKKSDEYAPNAPPVTFKSDYTNAAVQAFIQAKVDALRNTEKVHVVIALSHSGITDPNGTPAGDDITLAQNITGIDIIASGHDHETTNNIVPVVNGAHTSYIICAGANGTNLAQIDFTVNLQTKKIAGAPTLTNYAITSAIAGDYRINTLVQEMNTAINNILAPLGTMLSAIVATSSLDLLEPDRVKEFGLGNLLADAMRYVGTKPGDPTIGAFANGVIRGTFQKDQVIAFADLYAVVPLGLTTDDTQNPLLPGYPLLKVYANGNEIWDICKLDATLIGLNVFPNYFINLSGIKYTYTTGTNTINDVQVYAWNDYLGTGPTTPMAKGTGTLYPIIIDKYVMDMILTDSVQNLMAALSVSLHPKLADGTQVDKNNLMSARLDRDSSKPGIQEYSAWSGTLKYFTDNGGLNKTIPTVPYNLSMPRMIAE
jgi:5'-nucleotidase / UDP-sugar diphosphatase